MAGIVTITLNPALDIAAATPRVQPGPKLRCGAIEVDPGGGGINVSRAIKLLGGESRALVAIGGTTGERLQALLRDEGIDVLPFSGPGETRESVTINEIDSGQQYRFVFQGPVWEDAHTTGLLNAVDAVLETGLYLVLSGSQPPGIPAGFASEIAERARTAGSRLIVDTSRSALADLVAAPRVPLHVLRMNDAEAVELAGRALPDLQDTAAFARTLVDRGVAECIIVARGSEGSVLAMADGTYHARAADVPIRSKVGAGDSFVGAFTKALADGKAPPDALQAGAAAASAAVMTEGTKLCDPADATRLLAECGVRRLDAA